MGYFVMGPIFGKYKKFRKIHMNKNVLQKAKDSHNHTILQNSQRIFGWKIKG